ncbi:MAG: hypothetical protein D3915_03110 [Candidatus Electrothrix sp. AU1_5]|nr:hypothetical protein [Candidatus Electrothrix gigas]
MIIDRKVFAVPYNGTTELVKSVIDTGLHEQTYEFYGTDNAFISGRTNINTGFPSPEDFESDVKLMLENDIKFNYLLNGTHMDYYIANWELIEEKLKQLRDMGVTILTIVHPFMVRNIRSKGFDFHIRNSVNNFIECVDQAEMFLEAGYDSLIIDEDELRNIPLIQKIVKACKVPVEVMINNTCTRKCIHRFSHQSISSDPYIDDEGGKKFQNLAFALCSSVYRSNLSMFLKSCWVRPEDLERYLAIGVSLFKLTGRQGPTDYILRCLSIYASGSYTGNVLDYLATKGVPSHYGLKKLEAKYVEPYFEHVWNDCERDNCPKCQVIADQITEALKKENLLFPQGRV